MESFTLLLFVAELVACVVLRLLPVSFTPLTALGAKRKTQLLKELQDIS